MEQPTTAGHEQIAILDFGSQYTHLIARRFRQLGVLAKIYSSDYDIGQINGLLGVVLSGGPGSVNSEAFQHDERIFKAQVPILGLCFGHQLLAKYFSGIVSTASDREYGRAMMKVVDNKLFADLKKEEIVWMSHGDCVSQLPPGFVCIGTTSDNSIAAMANLDKNIYGLQFHPEVTHTDNGLQILKNFAFTICRARGDWDVSHWQEEIIAEVKTVVGNKNVFLLVSGGTDSTTCFALLEKALGKDRVYGLYIDTGMMRQGESEEIKKYLSAAGFDNLHIEYAEHKFLKSLEKIVDPESKRRIIGQTFLEVKDKVIVSLNLNPDEWILGQGTIYPDTIETGGSKMADVIKTHHNRVDAIQQLLAAGLVVEPIKDLYKDEVRVLGRALGLPNEIVSRHPFPGPGLGIRVLCSDGQTDLSEFEQKKLERELSEFIKVESSVIDDVFILPLKSVGVQGDNRTYAHPAVLQSKGFDYEVLDDLSSSITNHFDRINRVLLQLVDFTVASEQTDKKLIKTYVTKDILCFLRQIDEVVMKIVNKHKLYNEIWQFPVVLLPYGSNNKVSVVLRPVISQEAMTAKFYPLPSLVVKEIVTGLGELGNISCIFLDITNKPPGTIEWE